jgi:hypothetical protein
MIHNDIEVGAMFATGEEGFAIISSIWEFIISGASKKTLYSHIKIMLDNFHDKRSWINSLKVSPRHLKNKTHAARDDHNNPGPSFDFSNSPFGRYLHLID